MNNNFIGAITASLFAGSILLAGNASATNAYDVRAFGPKSPIIWNTPTKITFSHETHTNSAGLECSSCHDEIFAMQRGVASKSGKLNMASLAAGQFCGACHDGDTAFASDTNCIACHIAPQNPIVWSKPVKAVTFNHIAHTDEYGLECDSCHDGTFSMKLGAAEQSPNFTMKAIYAGQYCGKCHDGETAFSSKTLCNTCHIGVKGYNRMKGIDSPANKQDDTHGEH